MKLIKDLTSNQWGKAFLAMSDSINSRIIDECPEQPIDYKEY